MKRYIILVQITLFISSGLFGQSKDDYDEFLVSTLKLTTKSVVYGELDLTESENSAFDKLFDGYLVKRAEIAKDRLPIMVYYSENSGGMSEARLNEFNQYLMKTGTKIHRLNKKFYNKARKILPVSKVTKLMLVEHYLRNETENFLISAVFELDAINFNNNK